MTYICKVTKHAKYAMAKCTHCMGAHTVVFLSADNSQRAKGVKTLHTQRDILKGDDSFDTCTEP